MPSVALFEWQGLRQERISELVAAHAAVGGTGRGRRWRAEQLNWALVLRVAAEFQGFALDLHGEAVDAFVGSASRGTPSLEQVLRTLLTRDRQLTRGNAHPGAIGSDFDRLGLQTWPELNRRYPGRAPRWSAALTALNDARNGTHTQTKPRWRRWRRPAGR